LNSSLTSRVGLFGGTFNPIHNAHLHVAQTALEQCGLSKVIFVPNGVPPHKQDLMGVDKEDRYRMVCDAIAPFDGFEISRIEIDRDGPSYTIDTIRALKDHYPDGVCFIVGADKLLEIDTWREPEALLRSVPFVIAPRSGISTEWFHKRPFDVAAIYPLMMDEVDLSSSRMRERVRCGEPLTGWVPPKVERYIETKGLYKDRELSEVSNTK